MSGGFGRQGFGAGGRSGCNPSTLSAAETCWEVIPSGRGCTTDGMSRHRNEGAFMWQRTGSWSMLGFLPDINPVGAALSAKEMFKALQMCRMSRPLRGQVRSHELGDQRQTSGEHTTCWSEACPRSSSRGVSGKTWVQRRAVSAVSKFQLREQARLQQVTATTR
jgi:hypothetical protein